MRALIATALICVASQAFAHGPAEWIQRGEYKNAVGELCCGERDCGFFKSGTIERVHGGYQVDAEFQIEFGGSAKVMSIKGFVKEENATPSPTGEYWACSWGGSLKCFFFPPGLM